MANEETLEQVTLLQEAEVKSNEGVKVGTFDEKQSSNEVDNKSVIIHQAKRAWAGSNIVEEDTANDPGERKDIAVYDLQMKGPPSTVLIDVSHTLHNLTVGKENGMLLDFTTITQIVIFMGPIMTPWVAGVLWCVFDADVSKIVSYVSPVFGLGMVVVWLLPMNLDIMKLVARNFEVWFIYFQWCAATWMLADLLEWGHRATPVYVLWLAGFVACFNDAMPHLWRHFSWTMWLMATMMWGGLAFCVYTDFAPISPRDLKYWNPSGRAIQTTDALFLNTCSTLMVFTFKNFVKSSINRENYVTIVSAVAPHHEPDQGDDDPSHAQQET